MIRRPAWRSARKLGVAVALICASWTGCSFGMTTTVLPESTEGPIPDPFTRDETPALAPTELAGLFRAPSLGPNVYFHRPADLWYRRAYRRWYQAFRWNGHWFIVAETPNVLVGREIEKVKLPELPELPASPDDRLPELPDSEEPEGGFEPP